MGAKFCALWPLISGQKSKSPGPRDGSRSGSSLKEFIQFKCLNRRLTKIFKRKIAMETQEKKIPMAKRLALQDWILASPGLKPDYLMGGELSICMQSKKKVHPCSSQFRTSLIGEAKDSLCLDRPICMNHHEEGEEMPNCSSITRSLSGRSQKRVSFQLPHTVIFYSPDEQYCKEAASLCSPEKPYGSEDSFSSLMGPNFRENSFDSAEEPFFRLAVDTLPHVFVSSKI
ncbi:hypothetical protein SESBI_09807 [Sesbania bispinosa]|nr:hypothetical protein SESBI_09807 [Sesbania bispinosa]